MSSLFFKSKQIQKGAVETISLIILGIVLLGSYIGTQYLSKQRFSSKSQASTCEGSCSVGFTKWIQDCEQFNPDKKDLCSGWYQGSCGGCSAAPAPTSSEPPKTSSTTSPTATPIPSSSNAANEDWCCGGVCADSGVKATFISAEGGNADAGRDRWYRERGQAVGTSCPDGTTPTSNTTGNTATGCFHLTASASLNSENKCNIDVHFVSDGGDGDIRLDQAGKMIAGINGWNSGEMGSFVYSPQFTGSPYEPGEKVSFTGVIVRSLGNCTNASSSTTVTCPTLKETSSVNGPTTAPTATPRPAATPSVTPTPTIQLVPTVTPQPTLTPTRQAATSTSPQPTAGQLPITRISGDPTGFLLNIASPPAPTVYIPIISTDTTPAPSFGSLQITITSLAGLTQDTTDVCANETNTPTFCLNNLQQ